MAVLPLEGYRVVDLGWVLAGPIVGQVLADMGAEVIKIESRKRLDSSRQARPLQGKEIPEGSRHEFVPLFHAVNRNKLSLAIDLAHPRALPILKEIIKKSDVLIENFSPDVLPRLGLDYASIQSFAPHLVMVSMAGAGQHGPLRDVRTYASTVTALAGMDSLMGYEGDRVIGTTGISWADPNAALFAIQAVLTALWYREETGHGQYIDMAQLETTGVLLAEAVLEYTMNGRVLGRQGNRHPAMAPHGSYPCAGEDSWIALAVETEEEWQSLCRVMGEPAWARDERFADRYWRLQNRQELDRLLNGWTRTQQAEELSQRLQAAGVAATPHLNIGQQFAHPHFQERGLYTSVEHPLAGATTVYGIPWKLSDTPGNIRTAAPTLGQHTEHILRDIVGLSEEAIAGLRQEEVVS